MYTQVLQLSEEQHLATFSWNTCLLQSMTHAQTILLETRVPRGCFPENEKSEPTTPQGKQMTVIHCQ